MLEAENLVKQFEKNEKKHKKEDGMKQSQKLLLTWLIEYDNLYDKIKGIIFSGRSCKSAHKGGRDRRGIRSKWCRKDDAAADAWLSDAADGGGSPIYRWRPDYH